VDHILTELKYLENVYDVYLECGTLRMDRDSYRWYVYPPLSFPYQYMTMTPEIFWFRMGPFSFNMAEKSAKEIKNKTNLCLSFFDKLLNRGIIL